MTSMVQKEVDTIVSFNDQILALLDRVGRRASTYRQDVDALRNLCEAKNAYVMSLPGSSTFWDRVYPGGKDDKHADYN